MEDTRSRQVQFISYSSSSLQVLQRVELLEPRWLQKRHLERRVAVGKPWFFWGFNMRVWVQAVLVAFGLIHDMFGPILCLGFGGEDL